METKKLKVGKQRVESGNKNGRQQPKEKVGKKEEIESGNKIGRQPIIGGQ